MRDYLEQVVLKNLRAEIMHFFNGEPLLTSDLHKENVNRLFRGLDDSATANLSAILERLIKVTDPAVRTYRDLFTAEEFAQYERVKEFGREIIQAGDCFQYKHYKLPVKRFGNETFLYHHGLKALKTTAQIGNRAILDVGAYVGDSAMIFAERFPESPIYCFEPNAENFRHAQTTLTLNGLDSGRIKLVNAALGARKTRGIMMASSSESYLSVSGSAGDDSVEVNTLDDYVTANTLDVGLIKVDVEGSEQEVLEGALETIRTQKPILLLSIYHHYEQFFGIKPYLENLNLGYAFDFFWGVSGRLNYETMLLCEVR